MGTSRSAVALLLSSWLAACAEPSVPPPCEIDPWPYLNWLAQNTRPDPNRTIRYIAQWEGLRYADRLIVPDGGEQDTLAFLVEMEPSLEDRMWVIVTLGPARRVSRPRAEQIAPRSPHEGWDRLADELRRLGPTVNARSPTVRQGSKDGPDVGALLDLDWTQ